MFCSNPKVVGVLSPRFLSVVDCFKLMSFAHHATSELKQVNYDTFWIKNAPYILVTFDVDVIFELPQINNLDGHYSQMKGMDKKYNDHS
jgi:hypothetical protein